MGGCRACAYALTDNMMGYDPGKCLYCKKGYMEKTIQMFDEINRDLEDKYVCVDDIVK